MTKKQAPMTKTAAKRIQSNADRHGHNAGFKSRSSRAAAKNAINGTPKGRGK